MDVKIFASRLQLAQAAATDAADLIRWAITSRGEAYVIAATGVSQFEFLDALARIISGALGNPETGDSWAP